MTCGMNTLGQPDRVYRRPRVFEWRATNKPQCIRNSFRSDWFQVEANFSGGNDDEGERAARTTHTRLGRLQLLHDRNGVTESLTWNIINTEVKIILSKGFLQCATTPDPVWDLTSASFPCRMTGIDWHWTAVSLSTSKRCFRLETWLRKKTVTHFTVPQNIPT